MAHALAVREADFEKAVALTQRLQPDAANLPALTFLRDYSASDAAARSAMIARLEGDSGPIGQIVRYRLRAQFADHEAADRLAAAAPLATRTDTIRYDIDRAWGLAARGRFREAWPYLHRLAGYSPTSARWRMMLWAQLPMLAIAPADLEALLGIVESADSVPAAVPPNLYDGNHLIPHTRLYHLAFLHIRLGNLPEARSIIARLAALPTPEPRERSVHAMVESLQVRLLMREGRWAEALRRHEAIPLTLPGDMIELHPERFIRAELLLRAGRAEEALRWLDHFDAFFYGAVGDVFILDAPRALRRAQACEMLGRPQDARLWYGRFLELWKDADPEYRPLLDEARTRVTALLKQPR